MRARVDGASVVDLDCGSTIALLPWGDVIEDLLDSIGVSWDEFCDEMTGGWLFNYIEALRRVDIHTIIYCVTARAAGSERRTHRPTGATIVSLPATSAYRTVRRRIPNPYGWTVEAAFGPVVGLRRALLTALRDISPYLATPVLALAREIRSRRCAAILCQEYEYPRFDVCALIGRLTGLPVFASFQGGNFQLSRLEKYVRPWALAQCSGLIVASGRERERLGLDYSLPQAKVAKIFNPLDIDSLTPIPRAQARAALGIEQDTELVISHGRVEIHRKGLDILLDAWCMVRHDRPARKLLLLLVGSGNDAEELEQRIAGDDRGINYIREYIIDRQKIRQYLSAADLYVLASRHEGAPVAPLEAMCCSIPVVVTAVPGIDDILSSPERCGGLVVPAGDAVALAHALGRLLVLLSHKAEVCSGTLYRSIRIWCL